MTTENTLLKIKAIAHNIRQTREFRNYTQEYLASRLGISQNAYSKIELGYTKIPLTRIFEISEVLEVEVVELLTIKLMVVHPQ